MGIYCLTLFFNGAAQTDLDFKLRTQPLGDIELQIDAVLVDGSAVVVLPTSLDTQPAMSNGSPLALPFSTSTWSTISRTLLQVDTLGIVSCSSCQNGSPKTQNPEITVAILQASLDKSGAHDAKVVVTGRCVSEDDPFYDGLEFSFLVGIRPTMNGPAVSTTVQNIVLPTTVCVCTPVALQSSACCDLHGQQIP